MSPLRTSRLAPRPRALLLGLVLAAQFFPLVPATPGCPPEEAIIVAPRGLSINLGGVPWAVHLCDLSSWTLFVTVTVVVGPNAGALPFTTSVSGGSGCPPGTGHVTLAGTTFGTPPSPFDGGFGTAFLRAGGCSGALLTDNSTFILLPDP